MSSTLKAIWSKMKKKEYRDSFVAADISNSIAAQISTMREDRGWTQAELAERSGMRQPRISALEDPDFENVEIATLRRIASAFDVALSVRFVPFSTLAYQAANSSSEEFHVPEFAKDSLGSGFGRLMPSPISILIPAFNQPIQFNGMVQPPQPHGLVEVQFETPPNLINNLPMLSLLAQQSMRH